MRQNTEFPGQPILGQMLRLIPRGLIEQSIRNNNSDRYFKTFKSRDHLVAMLYCCLAKLDSLREVVTGLQAWGPRLGHLGLARAPARSTLAEANQNRSEGFFRDLFLMIHRLYWPTSPDSRPHNGELFVIDSTTLELFSEVMRGVGRKPLAGKRKGGAKAHMLINCREDVAQLVCITEARASDKVFMRQVSLPAGSILVFDRGYVKYSQWEEWGDQGLFWVTRATAVTTFRPESSGEPDETQGAAGVQKDEWGMLGNPDNRQTRLIKARQIQYKDPETGKELVFLTNAQHLSALEIAGIYRRRWQIETMFKRLKQNFPLRSFIGDSENAIRIQIWCSLIADLLVSVLRNRVARRKWSYANLASFIRLHLATYVNLHSFLNDPERALVRQTGENEPDLFSG